MLREEERALAMSRGMKTPIKWFLQVDQRSQIKSSNDADDHAASDSCKRRILGLSCVISVFPVVGYARIAENELYQTGEARLCSNIIRENYDAPLAFLKTHDRVRSLFVVATFEEAVTLRP